LSNMAGEFNARMGPAQVTDQTIDAAPPIDYYAALEIDSKSSAQQIREAYKKAALRYHPDRVAADSPERASRTKKFQQVNDAYYTLVRLTLKS